MKSLFHPAHKLYHWIHKKIWGDARCSADFVNDVINDLIKIDGVRQLKSDDKIKLTIDHSGIGSSRGLTPAELFDRSENPLILHKLTKYDKSKSN